MPSLPSLLAISLLAFGSIYNAESAPARGSDCVILPPGNYWIASIAGVDLEFLYPSESNGAGNTIVLGDGPPVQGQPGVWSLTNADQGGYHIANVQLGLNVSTIHLVESNIFLPEVAVTGSLASTYALECAGSGDFVIKNVTADLLWTTVASGSEPGVTNMEMLPSDGSLEQQFVFFPVPS